MRQVETESQQSDFMAGNGRTNEHAISTTGVSPSCIRAGAGNVVTDIEITTFNEAYDALKLAFPNPHARGKEFERYVKWWFMTDPRFDFSDVWLWDEWDDAWKTTEAGIDLVARHANGDLWAIQSKDYITNVIRDEVDRFVTESGRVGPDGKTHLFARRVFITTADSVSIHVDDLVTGPLPALPELVLWCREELEKAPVSWPASPDELHTPIPQPEPKMPRKYQKLALAKIADGFLHHDRGQLLMACGTGKTVTGIWVANDLKAQLVAVFVPNLGLLDQTFTDWKLNQTQFEALIVASDKSVGYDDTVNRVSQLAQRPTTDVEEIKAFLMKGSDQQKVIFSTYQSSLVLGDALKQAGGTLDLAIMDEAHRTAGKVGNEFTGVLDDAKVPANKRLFMTGTAKIYSPRVQRGGTERGVEVASMDNEKFYGPVFYELSFYDAIYKYKRLSDYRVHTIKVREDDPNYAKYLEWAIDRYVLDEDNDIDAGQVAAAIALIKAIKQLGLRSIIVSTTRVPAARKFAKMLEELTNHVDKKDRPPVKVWAQAVSGKDPTRVRKKALRRLRNVDPTRECGILCNARCLNEGIDVPALDGLMFADPKRSVIDIAQAVGRVVRRSEGKDKGHIMIPVFLKANDDPQQALEKSAAYKPVWNVVLAMREHDNRVAEWIDNYRFMLGKHGKPYLGPQKLPEQFAEDFGLSLDPDFYRAFTLKMVEMTSVTWWGWYGQLLAFVEENGHALVPFTSGGLGSWVNTQRTLYGQHLLLPNRRELLDKVTGWEWDPFTAQWDENYQQLVEWVHAKRAMPKRSDPLGKWIDEQRAQFRDRKLAPEREALLRAQGWEPDPREANWKKGLEELEEYVKHKHDALVDQKYKAPSGFRLGQWVADRRNEYAASPRELSRARIAVLNSIKGWEWVAREAKWKANFNALERFVAQKHRYPMQGEVFEGHKLGNWVTNQRAAKKSLGRERVARLGSLPGWAWNTFDAQWMEKYLLLKAYVEEKHAVPPRSSELGVWCTSQRAKRRSKEGLRPDRVKLLNKIEGWDWNPPRGRAAR